MTYGNALIEALHLEMASCYPAKWAEMTPTERAKSIAKQFKAEFEEMIYRRKFEELEAKKAAELKAKQDEERERIAADKKKEALQVYHGYWNKIVSKAHGTFGDYLYELACSKFGTEDGPEKLCSGAFVPSEEEEEDAMREALYIHWSKEADRQRYPHAWYDKAIKYWKKNWR